MSDIAMEPSMITPDDNRKRCVKSRPTGAALLDEMIEMQKRIEALPELYSSMQKFFMKKEQEYGLLSNLLSRATTETSSKIDQIVQGILRIYDSHNVLPTSEKLKAYINLKVDVPIISSIQVMLMNTNFYSQYRLAEDMLRGHQVGLWPKISPYLLIQIIWGLHCEELLPRFVLYLPLELSIEILTVTIPCLAELEFQRAINLVTQLANYMYKLIYRLSVSGTQTHPYEEHIHQLLASFQELSDQLTNPRVTRLPDISEQLRYEHQGIILKNIIRLSKLCTTERMHGGIDDNAEKLYMLTFGNELKGKLPSTLLLSCIDQMDQALVLLLMKHLKEVNCHMYLAWAEMEDRENPLLSLQRAIITECVYFGKVIQTDKLQQNQELQMCLDQLVGSNKQPQLTLKEICDGVQSGQLKDLKELLLRYHEWDESMLQFISTWERLLTNENFEVLFKYLKHIFSVKQYTPQEKLKLQTMVIEIMLKRSMEDIYNIVLIYVLHYYHDNFLEELYDPVSFYTLLRQAGGIWNNPFFMKSLLIHILHRPQEVLMSLIYITVNTSNECVCTPQQLLILRPFLCLKISEDQTILSKMLYKLCFCSHRWDIQKYTNFVTVMLGTFVISPEDILNNVFIRYLVEQPFDQINVSCILINICKIVDTYTPKFGVVELCVVVARKISNWRKCEPTKRRTMVNELMTNLLRVLNKCVRKPYLMTVEQKRQVLNTILPHIEPLDKAVFAPLLYLVQGDILSIINDYTRRCYIVRRKFKEMYQRDIDMFLHIDHIPLEKQDFIRHMMLHAVEMEYYRHCLDMTLKYWFFFGWLSEWDAYDNVTRITMEAVCVGLEYKENVPPDNFSMLLKNCIRFTEMLSWDVTTFEKKDMIIQILLKNMYLVVPSTQGTQYYDTYNALLANLENIVSTKKSLSDFIIQIGVFISNMSNEADEDNRKRTRSHEMDDMIDSYKFICGCFSIPGTEKHHRFVEKIKNIIFSEDCGYLNYHPL
ncbi:uncharacterized protein LOC105187941 isoform X2 [Harpegnathos saltator]|nr:uncharacterized protein LOC105187941 isoform X2 [Harpegnathos saltator]